MVSMGLVHGLLAPKQDMLTERHNRANILSSWWPGSRAGEQCQRRSEALNTEPKIMTP